MSSTPESRNGCDAVVVVSDLVVVVADVLADDAASSRVGACRCRPMRRWPIRDAWGWTIGARWVVIDGRIDTAVDQPSTAQCPPGAVVRVDQHPKRSGIAETDQTCHGDEIHTRHCVKRRLETAEAYAVLCKGHVSPRKNAQDEPVERIGLVPPGGVRIHMRAELPPKRWSCASHHHEPACFGQQRGRSEGVGRARVVGFDAARRHELDAAADERCADDGRCVGGHASELGRVCERTAHGCRIDRLAVSHIRGG
jgi:hypothetical protein